MSTTQVTISITSETKSRSLNDIINVISKSTLDSEIQNRGIQIFTHLAEIEANIHQKHIEEIQLGVWIKASQLSRLFQRIHAAGRGTVLSVLIPRTHTLNEGDAPRRFFSDEGTESTTRGP